MRVARGVGTPPGLRKRHLPQFTYKASSPQGSCSVTSGEGGRDRKAAPLGCGCGQDPAGPPQGPSRTRRTASEGQAEGCMAGPTHFHLKAVYKMETAI